MKRITMRDAFFGRLYEIAKVNRDIIVISADMGAPSLDKFREDLPEQFINVGIAEANMITVASGLSLSGKRTFVYAIMPFATLRCYEMIKVNLSLMNLPVTIVGVGAGFSYDDSGPTHHATEDIAVMRTLPGITIFNPSDIAMTRRLADMACNISGPSYIRLDRKIQPVIYPEDAKFSEGLSCLKPAKDICIIATGNMVHTAFKVSEKLKKHSLQSGVVDLYRIKPVNIKLLLRYLAPAKRIVTLEEHLASAGIGGLIAEILVDNNKKTPLKRIAIPDKYYYAYGGRENIQSLCGIDTESIVKTILNWNKKCQK